MPLYWGYILFFYDKGVKLYMADDNAELRSRLSKGATPEQKKAILYLLPKTGCLSFIRKVSDSDYDALVKRLVDSANTYKRAIDKIGMDEDDLKEIPPVTLVGYEDGDYQRGTDYNAFRSNKYSVTHLFFSDQQVFMYQIILNTIKGDRKERTEEYFYKDITNFSTSTDSIQVKYSNGKSDQIEVQRFSLIVPGDKFTCATFGDIDQQVKAMKNKLREKKM